MMPTLVFSHIRGDPALAPGSLVVARRRETGFPHHRRLAGPQHGSAPVHGQHLPTGTAVPVSHGGVTLTPPVHFQRHLSLVSVSR